MNEEELQSGLPSSKGSPFKTKNFNKFFFGIIIATLLLLGLFLLFFLGGNRKTEKKRQSSQGLREPVGRVASALAVATCKPKTCN